MANKPTETKPAPAPAKNANEVIYDKYVHGKNCDDIALEVGLDSLEVLAIIQEIEQSRSKKG